MAQNLQQIKNADFYPRPPRGGRLGLPLKLLTLDFNFYPRPPRGGRQTPTSGCPSRPEFLSTPSARRATHRRRFPRGVVGISIHALREEGDRW